MTPALKTHDLAVGYGRQSVLSHINLAVAPGELVCLLGVNGIGKSTLMRTLAWMQPALGGSVEIDGRDISRMNQGELARKVAVVLTERVAIGAMPAYGLVALGRYPHTGWAGQLSDADRDIVAEAIAAVGAQHLAQRDINELSDGERQRILIARALAQRPAVLLLDEPSAFLDVSARVEIMAMLRRLAREQQVAFKPRPGTVAAHCRYAMACGSRGRDACGGAGGPACRRQRGRGLFGARGGVFDAGAEFQDSGPWSGAGFCHWARGAGGSGAIGAGTRGLPGCRR
jgi:ABC-type cobalamin/Fe3+-siderophores transport system ATPase subunit